MAREGVVEDRKTRIPLRERSREILDQWLERARAIGREHGLLRTGLLDHMPLVLDAITDFAEDLEGGLPPRSPSSPAAKHAVDRLHEGFDLVTVLAELSLLREVVVDVLDADPRVERGLLGPVHAAIDRTMLVAVEHYTRVRDRTMRALDRISVASLEGGSLSSLLNRLLLVFVETVEAVDAAAILLREGDLLRTRAAVGLEGEVESGFTLRFGEGFAGTIAAERRPLEVEEAHADPLVQSPFIRELRLRGIYGAPLMERGEVIGVAHMGSRSAARFSEQDKQLFLAMVNRATSAIGQYLLREDLAKTKADAQRSHAQLDALVKASPVAIGFIDRELRYVTVNEALASMNGVPAADHLGRTIAEVLSSAQTPQVEALVRRVFDTGESIANAVVPIHDGTRGERWFLVNYFPVRLDERAVSGMGAVIAEITDQKVAEDRARRTAAELTAVIEALPHAVFIGSAERLRHVNAEGARLVGEVSTAELVGRPTNVLADIDAYDPESKQRIPFTERPFARALAGARSARDLLVRMHGDTQERLLRMAAAPIVLDGAIIGAVSIGTDLSERKRIEERLRETTAELERALRFRDNMLSVVSHDLRTPLGTIQINAALLLKHIGVDEGGRRLRKIGQSLQRSAGSMTRLIHDLVDFASIQEGRLTVVARPEDCGEIVRETIDSLSATADERRIDLRAEVPDLLKVACDRDRIFQVLANIIGNALRVTPVGGSIVVRARPSGREIVVSVSDSGPGLSPEELDRVFVRAWRSPTSSYKGTGLGLTIAKGIVDAHGGRIWAESHDGATFSFTLPIAEN